MIKQQKKLIYSVVLVSAVQQSESVVCIYPFFFRFFSHRCRKQTYGYPVSKGEDKLGDQDWHMHTPIYKVDN